MFNEHKRSWVAGFELLIIIVTVLVASYAWLNNSKKINTDSIMLKADSHFNLLISLDEGETWVTESSLDILGNFEFKHEITGNGINMYIPSNKKDDGTPVSFTNAVAQRDYLEFSVMFKLAANVSIFLDKLSFVSPAVGTTNELLFGRDVERVNPDGDFSRDLIASSVRIAFIENELIDGEYVMNTTPSLVWAPNKDYEVQCTTDCTASINSTNEQEYKYIEAANIPVVEVDVNNLKDEINASGEEQDAHGDPMLTTIDVNENEGVKKVTLRIWIEGNDRDNTTALTGGLFQMNVQFSAIQKGLDNTEPNVLVGNDNTIIGYSEGMEHSVNNGRTWIKYENDSNPIFTSNTKVLVRKSENLQYFASRSKTLNF